MKLPLERMVFFVAYTLNEKIRNLEPYQPIEGDYRVRLDANESFMRLPAEQFESAALDVLNNRINRYPDPYAEKLCGAFGDFYDIKSCYVTAGNGSDELISLITGAFFMPGEELVTLANDFSMYRFYGSVYGVKTSIFPKRDDLTVDVDALAEYINRSGAKGLIFSNPCNPTSLCLDRRQVLRLIESVPDCLVIVDEAYMDFADESILDKVHHYENLIVLKTCSKAVGLAAIRLGFAVAGDTITKALRAVKSPYNVNDMTQSIGYQILSDGEYVVNCIEKIIRSRDSLYNGILGLHMRHKVFDMVYPTTTNFVFIKTPCAQYIYEELLDRSIAIRCMGDYLRITAGSKVENEAVLDALEEIMADME